MPRLKWTGWVMCRVAPVFFSIWMLIVFLQAYMSPYKISIININAHGEANVELVILCITIPFIILTTGIDILDKRRQECKQ